MYKYDIYQVWGLAKRRGDLAGWRRGGVAEWRRGKVEWRSTLVPPVLRHDGLAILGRFYVCPVSWVCLPDGAGRTSSYFGKNWVTVGSGVIYLGVLHEYLNLNENTMVPVCGAKRKAPFFP